MGLLEFLGLKRKKRAFVFYCKSKPCFLGSINWFQLGDSLRSAGCTAEEFIIKQPDWNKRIYSSVTPTPEECLDLLEKVETVVTQSGYKFDSSRVHILSFADSNSGFGKLGLFSIMV